MSAAGRLNVTATAGDTVIGSDDFRHLPEPPFTLALLHERPDGTVEAELVRPTRWNGGECMHVQRGCDLTNARTHLAGARWELLDRLPSPPVESLP